MAADSNSHQEFYFVAYPFLELPELKSAEKQFYDNLRKRNEIVDILDTKTEERKELAEKLNPLEAEEEALMKRCEEIRQRLSELNFKFTNAREPENLCSSEAEIDREERELESQILEGRIAGTEERHLLKQIKDLERSRGQVLSIEDWNLKRKLKDISNGRKELSRIDSEISALKKDRLYYVQATNQAHWSLEQLRMQRYNINELCLQMRAEMDNAIFDYRVNPNPNPSALKDRSKLEVEKFMRRWNENNDFRQEYQRRMSIAGNAQYPRKIMTSDRNINAECP